jgi:hypothetical protein
MTAPRPGTIRHPFDGAGRTCMQYINGYGSYRGFPAKFLIREMASDQHAGARISPAATWRGEAADG